MIDLGTARKLLDFSARLQDDKGRADQQLEGAVALHNILLGEPGVAYLADEVGLGKTYVALGVVALLRHFDPKLRLLVIAPRENIQKKWMKEMRNFIRYNVMHADLRVKELDGSPSRPLVFCRNLPELVREASLDPGRDFFARMTSFSVGLAGDRDEASRAAKEKLRAQVREAIPWISDSALDLDLGKAAFKDAVARAVCCALPEFDLVIVDEGHNLKHGFSGSVAARNRVMGLVFGHPTGRPDTSLERLFPGYGPRAKKVLFLSATPVEESYRHLWRQLDVFGKGAPFALLDDAGAGEAKKREEARRFLIRRVTEIQVAGKRYTKNLYRREWRFGGVDRHDLPIELDDVKSRLVVALVQKKVMERLGSEKFGTEFQIGMLASFESFLQTPKVREALAEVGEEEERPAAVFDDGDQTDDRIEREGLDVPAVNLLAKDYESRFDGQELPHPKMDALVETLAGRWISGRKALVFVRRIGSVKELKAKLEARYDEWLMDRLRRLLPPGTLGTLEGWWSRYRQERDRTRRRGEGAQQPEPASGTIRQAEDPGSTDTFFSWFFRGIPKKGVFSGALLQRTFTRVSSANATFFEVNDVARMLDASAGKVLERLAEVVGLPVEETRARVNLRGLDRLPEKAQRFHRFEAAQVGGLRLLADAREELAREALIILAEKYPAPRSDGTRHEGADFADRLEERTFFSELRRWESLRAELWPEPSPGPDHLGRVREREQRAQLLASAARLGHSLIDLYILAVSRRGNLNPGRADGEEEENEEVVGGVTDAPGGPDVEVDGSEDTTADALVEDFLRLLEGQRTLPPGYGWFGAYDELSAIGKNFPLIVDVNLPDLARMPLGKAANRFGNLLGRQQPVAGMSGQVNPTVVQQFRMPGYPFVLVSTDLLQEGEDLHTFCSDVFHYGISWTASAMEQRIGRIDRVRSLTERRIREGGRIPEGDQKLQVYYPYLADTVDVLQVVRILKRMDTFLRLMHEDLAVPDSGQKKLSVAHEIMGRPIPPPTIETLLRSAFPVLRDKHLNGEAKELAVDVDREAETLQRLDRMCVSQLGDHEVEWMVNVSPGQKVGNVRLGPRQQPFVLEIQGQDERLILRCTSRVGLLGTRADQLKLDRAVREGGGRIHVIKVGKKGEWLVSVSEDVFLAGAEHDADRFAWLVGRVVRRADDLEHHLFGKLDAGIQEQLEAQKDYSLGRQERDAHA